MRFVVLGAGAIGGVVAARLVQHGHDVVAIARGDHGEAIRRSGLVVETAAGRDTVHLPVFADPAAVTFQDGDVVLLAVKSQHTQAALESLQAAAPPSTPVVCLQNGVANERTALRHFARVYGVCVMCPAAHLEPGVVVAHSHPITGILDGGRYPTGTDATIEATCAALASSTFVSEPRPDIMRWKHRKLIMNLANAVEALCGPEALGHRIVRMAREEGEACLQAAGVDVASADEDRARRGDLLTPADVGTAPRAGSSWQSLRRATGSIEADHLNGEIVLLGRLHGFPTPVNALLQTVAGEHARHGRPPGTVDPDELLRRVGDS